MQPDNKRMHITLLRQWEMMRLLTVSRSDNPEEGRWDRASEIAAKLKERGYEVSVRTVQRDLKELSTIFPIDLNDVNQRDYGWRWKKGENLNIQGMSASEALAMRLVEMQLQQQLPDAMLDALQGVFNLARKRLDDLEAKNNSKAKGWLNKIRVVQPTQALLPPNIDEEVQSKIYQALLDNCQICVGYTSMENTREKEYVLHPLGIIMRGTVSYLVASAWDYPDVRLYALHRFSEVQIMDEAVKTPKGFNLDKAIAGGIAHFAIQGGPIQLEIRCSESVVAYLNETKLSEDQQMTPEENGWMRMTATVNDTWQLRWWLMGQGAGLEVCAPKYLRSEIKNELNNAAMLYI
jgi:predicted DNA-binding transcriptional regulator YafY